MGPSSTPRRGGEAVESDATGRVRPERQRTDVDYRKLHRGSLATTALPGKAKEVGAATPTAILEAVLGVQKALMVADERTRGAEERAEKAEERAGKAEGRMESMARKVEEMAGQITGLREAMSSQAKDLRKELQEAYGGQIEALRKEITTSVQTQLSEIQAEITAAIQMQLANIQLSPSASPSYANVARTPPISHPSNLSLGTSGAITSSSLTDTLYCTIDTSRVGKENEEETQPGVIRAAIEKEIRSDEDMATWRCAAVTKDMRNTTRIRVACRSEEELQRVKEASEKALVTGTRVLRDQLYPVKVDNANRKAVLESDGSIRTDAAERLGKENEVRISKIAWISRKDNGKDYGSMIIYVNKGSEAARLLRGQYFHLDGESAFTRVCEPRTGPIQCYNCQAMGHKAFQCRKSQVCGKCAKEGHHHSRCLDEIPKCVPCGGPHESYSKSCRITHPIRHE
jgi:hypothetical protein